jgi:HEAT repeat protein
MRKRLLVLLWVAVVLTAAAVVVFAVPAWRFGLLARLRGEPLYQGHPVAYWANELETGDENRRLVARLQLREIGTPAVPYLLEALRNDDPGVREDAAAALAGVATREPPDDSVPALLAALGDPEPRVRGNVAAALGHVVKGRADEVIAALSRIQQDDLDPVARTEARIALARLRDRQAVKP